MNLSVTLIDFLVVAVILISAGYAAWRGFMSEVLTILSWAAAAFATLYVGPYVVPMARSVVSTAWVANVIGYAAVFLAVFIPLSFMSHRVAQSVHNSPVGSLDRLMGVVFGVLRGLVIVGVAYVVVTLFVAVPEQPLWLTRAQLLPLIQSSSEVLLSLVPEQDRVAVQSGGAPSETRDPLADVIQRSGTAAERSEPAPGAKKRPRALATTSNAR